MSVHHSGFVFFAFKERSCLLCVSYRVYSYPYFDHKFVKLSEHMILFIHFEKLRKKNFKKYAQKTAKEINFKINQLYHLNYWSVFLHIGLGLT
jgi:hypothetical protein